MHELVPKHILLGKEEAEKLLAKFNISKIQLPKIKKSDPALPPNAKVGDIIKIERIVGGKKVEYFRVVVK